MIRILVVEDEPLIAMMLAEWLVEMGHEPLGPARTVSEALALIDGDKPDAAMLDVNLAGERCDRIVEVLSALMVPIAFATGGDTQSLPASFNNSVTLAKPYDFDAVRGAVESLVGKGGSAVPTA